MTPELSEFTKSGKIWTKHVDFSMDILWNTREISMSVSDYKKIIEDEDSTIIEFKDLKRNTSLIFNKNVFKDHAETKQMHKENQYYISIDVAKKGKGKL